MTKSLIYLAAPYTHPEYDVMLYRVNSINKAAASLMAQRLHIYSPISHTHPIAEAGDLPRGFDFWEAYDRAILDCCCKVIVLMLPGWRESKGVQAEIKIAAELGIPVEYMEAT